LHPQRLALRAVEDRLETLLRELADHRRRLPARLRPVAARWLALVIARRRELDAQAEADQEIDSPYVVGLPLGEQQEIFVGRTDIGRRLERLVLDPRRPPLLLYGQRRMGKTSLLNNLGRLLPSTIVPVFVDLQGPTSHARDDVGFFSAMAHAMVRSARERRRLTWPALPRDQLARDPFVAFEQWLADIHDHLGDATVLLVLDEFEALEHALGEGRLSESGILGTLRHVIQHWPRFKLLMAGSHTLDEMKRWPSYLINVQTLHVGYLNEAAARKLVEEPVKGFPLRYEPAASARALALTRGHPYLLQLLCAEIIAVKNEQPASKRWLATCEDVEEAAGQALASGRLFFEDVQLNQCGAQGETLLRFLASQGEGRGARREAVAGRFSDCEPALRQLQGREIIEEVDGTYRFQVELVRQWFAREGGI
jgi:hypothetical protein